MLRSDAAGESRTHLLQSGHRSENQSLLFRPIRTVSYVLDLASNIIHSPECTVSRVVSGLYHLFTLALLAFVVLVSHDSVHEDLTDFGVLVEPVS